MYRQPAGGAIVEQDVLRPGDDVLLLEASLPGGVGGREGHVLGARQSDAGGRQRRDQRLAFRVRRFWERRASIGLRA